MCLGIPGKVVEIRDDGPMRMATVDYGGARKEACLAYVPEVGLGDYVIVHVGFAISQLDERRSATDAGAAANDRCAGVREFGELLPRRAG